MTKPLIFAGGALADAFYAVAIGWGVFEGVTRNLQRLRAGHLSPVSLSDPSVIAVGGGIGASVVVSLELGFHAVLPWPAGRVWPVAVGIAAIAAGLAVRVWAIVSLGRFFQYQIEIQRGHQVVTRGPYRYVRHPSYTGISLVMLGFAFGSGAAASLPAVVVLTGLGLCVRIWAEEHQLVAALGAEYEDFAAHRKRLIPGVF